MILALSTPPHIDWLALSAPLALLGAGGVTFSPRCSSRAACAADLRRDRLRARVRRRDRRRRDPLRPQRRRPRRDRRRDPARPARRALGDHRRRLRAPRDRHLLLRADGATTTSPSTTRCLPGPARGWSSSQRDTLLTLFLGLEWFSISLYILCAIDLDLVGSLEAGLKYLIIGGFGSAILLFGSALVYGATGSLEFDEIARGRGAGPPRRRAPRRGPGADHRRARVQGLGGAVPHVDARRLRGRADARDRLHVGCDEDRRRWC